ncbi:MAG: putative 6-carboxyhexanoate--COA ligase [Marmoricola sp.]|nr:putative 6-carboxyhexanoate--COA ligase [Marmoricola sp.]
MSPTAPLDPRVLFAPSSVAVIGASSNPGGHAGRALANLVRTEFPGRIYPINPKYDELLGLRCYPDIGATPDPAEVAYVLLPAPAAVEAVRAAGIAGVKVAVVCSSGFSELGEDGDSLEAELRVISAEHGIRVIGPNCIGIISPSGGFVGAPTFNITYDQSPGGVAVLSHSGGIAVTVFNRAQAAGVGVHSVVSLGNEADVTMTDVLEALLADDEVHTIALVVEQLRAPSGFLAAARAARAAGKRVVALKTGRSAAGSAAVAGHTGALAGNAAIFSALMREAGVLEATSIDQLIDTVHLLARLPERAIGNRLGVVSPSGGETVYVADQSVAHGIELPPLSAELAAEIHAWMPLGNPANPLDLTGRIIGDSSLLTKVLDALGGQTDVDLLLVCLATWGEYDADAILSTVIDSARSVRTPVVFSAWDAGAMTDRVVALLRESGLPWFPSPDRALAAISLASRDLPVTPVVAPGTPVPRPDGFADGSLGEYAAGSLLATAGIPMARTAVVATPAEAVAVATAWDAEVVLKLNAPDVLHKSELGLVEVDLPGTDAIRAGAERLLARAEEQGLPHDGLLVARKESGTEVIVGGVRDPAYGPFVLLGAGGILAEYLKDTVMVAAPAAPETVRAALESLSSYPVLQGVRGRSQDVDALVDLVVGFSAVFAASFWMDEVDLNPVVVRSTSEGGAVAVDAVIVSHSPLSTGATP